MGDDNMKKLKLILKDGKSIWVDEGTSLHNIVKENSLEHNIPVVLGKLNDDIYELSCNLEQGGRFDIIDISTDIGMKAYVRTLQFVLIKAVFDLFPEARISIEHSLSKGIYGEIYKNDKLSKEDIQNIKEKMKEIIQKDIPINKISVEKAKAIEIFKGYNKAFKICGF